ncbi:ATP-binding protein [Ornithinibacillus bavariensis]|uniref:sensor histidine kinase n=1 Tax=Ornithinibacillus bavariensis TaxID=545502 RepID=UPI003D234974
MRTTRIRTLTIYCIFLTLLVPWLFFLPAHFITTKQLHIDMDDLQKEQLEDTIHLVDENTHNWTNPNWQRQFKHHLQQMNMDVSIQSQSNQVIFQSTSKPNKPFMKTEHFSVIQDGELLGRVTISYTNSRIIPMIAAIGGLIFSIIIIACVVRFYILKPLERLSYCARQIAEGDLDVNLPKSFIKEVADVNEGFSVMVKGLKEAFQKQAALEEERRFVIAAVAHDLRTPLFALRGYLAGLDQGIADSPEKRAKYIAVCKEKSQQLDRLVEDLFTYTKTDYLEVKLNKSTVFLTQLIQLSIENLTPNAQEKNIAIVLNKSEDDGDIFGDSHLLGRAINNLMDNAVRHTPFGGNIFVHSYQADGKHIFTLRDTGEGFSTEELKRAFEPLYRGEVSRNRHTGGSGLGLTIAQRIIRHHGGDIVLKNHPEGGAIITGWIPLHPHLPQ